MSSRYLNYLTWQSSYEQLATQIERRRLDKRIEEQGGTVIYALDNDVITIVTAPWRTAHQHYLRLFGNEDLDAIEALAYVFGEFFLSHSSASPYVIVRPAEVELEGMWNYVYEQALSEQTDLTTGLDRILKGDLGQTPRDDQALFDIVRRVLELVYGKQGHLTELKRISRIVELGGIRRMDTVVNENGGSPFPTESVDDTKQIAKFEQIWLQMLNRSRPKEGGERNAKTLPKNNLVDAAVLARIQWINLRYQEEGINSRLCLITGDSHIEKVASLVDFCGESFAAAFVRSPTCFLDDETFFTSMADRASDSSTATNPPDISIGDCLRVLSPAAHVNLTEFASKESERNIREETNSAMQQWAIFLKSIAAASQFNNDRFKEALREHLDASNYLHIADVRSRFEMLKNELASIGDEALARFGVSGALAAFWSLDYRNRRVERSIPPVKFDSLKEADAFLGQLRDSSNFEALQRAVDRHWISVLREEDESGYTALIVFSLAHACAGEWSTALTVARAAVLAAKRMRGKVSRETSEKQARQTIKGDEAAYLCAIFARLSARDMRALDDSETWLELADELQKLPPIRSSLQNVDLSQYLDPRFVAERLAIRLCRRFFAEFSESSQRDIHDGLVLRWRARDECEKLLALFPVAASEKSENVRQYIQEQLAVNFLQWQLLAKARGDEASLFPKKSKEFIEFLNNSFERSSLRIASDDESSFMGRSRLVYFVYLCATAAFSPDSVGWLHPETRPQLLQSLGRTGDGLNVMPYDEARATLFSNVAKQSLGLI